MPTPERQKGLSPFESVFVGNFLFLTGYEAGRTGALLEGNVVALFAQNRADKIIGDLLQEWRGRFFIFEFKRNREDAGTERAKPHKEKLLQTLTTGENVAGKTAFSRKGHFVAFGDSLDDSFLTVMEYVDIADGLPPTARRWRADDFIREELLGAKRGFSKNDFARYLAVLEWCAANAGQAGASSGGGRGVDANDIAVLVMNVDESGKRIRFTVCDIGRTRELTLERSMGLEPPHSPDRARGFARDLDDERGRGRGRGGLGR